MTSDKFDVWMICMENDPRREIVLPSWNAHTVNCFNAITPDTRSLVKEKLNFDKFKYNKIKGKILFSEGEKASFTSHVLLWKKCFKANRPFCIIEEDVELGQPIPDDILIRGIIPIAMRRKGSEVVTPAAGYILEPLMALRMYRYFVELQNRITYNVDHHIHQRIHPREWHSHPYAYQIEGASAIARN
tara:strand:+ start:52 stop:615 length:564 start_codon:yes stop_codon:yes gene_type:complete